MPAGPRVLNADNDFLSIVKARFSRNASFDLAEKPDHVHGKRRKVDIPNLAADRFDHFFL